LLGACLHEIATGAPPHAGETTALALEHAVASEPLDYPDSVPRELADICRRAMAKAPEDRYPSVAALREAVESFVTHSAARVVTEKGLRALERLDAQLSAFSTGTDDEKRERERVIHRTYSEARFAFELALESWPDDEDGRHGLERSARTMLAHALDTEDLALSTRLVAEVADAELTVRVEALRAKAAAREAELAALREQAKLLDSSVVSGPLGTVFIAAGVVGGVASIPTRMWLEGGAEAAVPRITTLWACIAVGAGALAYAVLRRAEKSLISPRVGWTWAAVGGGCLLSGVVANAQGEAPFQNASYATMMIAIGFVAMAMQTRLWVLLPAVVTVIGSLAMGFLPGLRIEIFGVLWFVTLTGVGVALRRGARFDSAEPGPRRG